MRKHATEASKIHAGAGAVQVGGDFEALTKNPLPDDRGEGRCS
jgi:hypothetical protein